MIKSGNKVEKTHDLVLLNNKCKVIDRSFNIIEDECIELVPYGVQVRYQYQLDVTAEDMISAIECAEKIEKFINGKIEK